MSEIATRWSVRLIGWITAGLLLLALLTGYGITEFRVVTPFTFGLLDKATSLRVHSYLGVPLIALLLCHLGTSLLTRRGKRH